MELMEKEPWKRTTCNDVGIFILTEGSKQVKLSELKDESWA